MNNGLLSIKNKKTYTDAEVEMARWKTEKRFELGLISDPYSQDKSVNTSSNFSNSKELLKELTNLEYEANNYIDNYTEVPDEIKNRIFELRKILWG